MPATWLIVTAVVIMIVLGIFVVVQLIAITVLMLVAKNILQEVRERIDPVIAKVNNIMSTVNEMAQKVQDKTEHIADTTAHATDVVADRVDKTSGLMQRAVSAPIIGGAAAAEGIREGISTWKKLRKRRQRAVQPGTVTLPTTEDEGALGMPSATEEEGEAPAGV